MLTVRRAYRCPAHRLRLFSLVSELQFLQHRSGSAYQFSEKRSLSTWGVSGTTSRRWFHVTNTQCQPEKDASFPRQDHSHVQVNQEQEDGEALGHSTLKEKGESKVPLGTPEECTPKQNPLEEIPVPDEPPEFDILEVPPKEEEPITALALLAALQDLIRQGKSDEVVAFCEQNGIPFENIVEAARQQVETEEAEAGAEAAPAEDADVHSTDTFEPEYPDKEEVPYPKNAKDSYKNFTEFEEQDPEKVVRGAKEMFRDTLPKNYLTEEEQEIYRRLYGEPLRETTPEDVGMPPPDVNEIKSSMKDQNGQNALLRETDKGNYEEVDYNFASEDTTSSHTSQQSPPIDPNAEQLDFIMATAKNRREYAALVKLQKDFDAAARQHIREEEAENKQDKGDEDVELNEEWDELEEQVALEPVEEQWPDDMEAYRSRSHPFTEDNRFRTHPKTILLSRENIIEPITEILKRTHVNHVREAGETNLGGPGFPHSPATRRNKYGMYPQFPVGLDAGAREMSEITADSYLSIIFPFNYATSLSTMTEVRKRMGSSWIRKLMSAHGGSGPRILDVGGGGAAARAWEDVIEAEWAIMKENGEVVGQAPEPHGRKTVIVGSDALRHRISRLLQNTTFLPRLPDYVHSQNIASRLMDSPAPSQGRKSYDLIIASHQFMKYSPAVNEKDSFRRDFMLENLWSLLNPDGGVLLVVEKGHPRGFEEVAEIRRRLLEEFIVTSDQTSEDIASVQIRSRKREHGRIIAPCTNHTHCPMYLNPGVTEGRKDFCHFKQRFIRPHFLQRLLQAKHFNHEDVQFSYLAIQRGVLPPSNLPSGKEAADRAFKGYLQAEDPPHPSILPRNILQPLKRTGHVVFDLCTPEGQLERWTLPRSYSRQAYHDARKAKWGDLWALGAKTRVHRAPRLGRKGTQKEAMLKRVYRVEKEYDEEGNEQLVVPALGKAFSNKTGAGGNKEAGKMKNKKQKVTVKRTSRHNRKVEFMKEMREREEAQGSRFRDLEAGFSGEASGAKEVEK